MNLSMESSDIITFWFVEISPRQWFIKDSTFDNQIRQRFAQVHLEATHCELSLWRETSEDRFVEKGFVTKSGSNDKLPAIYLESCVSAAAEGAAGIRLWPSSICIFGATAATFPSRMAVLIRAAINI